MMLRGFFVLLLYFINCIPIPVTIIFVGAVQKILPVQGLFLKRFLAQLASWWNDALNVITRFTMRGRLTIEAYGELKADQSVLLICNHQSWADILILFYVFQRKTPLLKFFMKRQLLWALPIIGLTMRMMNYPFLVRPTLQQVRKNPKLKHIDLAITRKACKEFQQVPASPVTFVEGTRFSEAKRMKKKSPYQHLLKPHAGSMAVLLQEMSGHIDHIVDVSIDYAGQNSTLFDFMCGRIKQIKVRYDVLPVTPDLMGDFVKDREYRKHLQGWLNARWQIKDEWMS